MRVEELTSLYEQGLLLKMPCRARTGDVVYMILDGEVVEDVITIIKILESGVTYYASNYSLAGKQLSADDFGKWVFFDRETAENKLKAP